MSMFDIIGPVMIGPSSSHTAGAARIGLTARHIFHEEPAEAEITVYGSFAKTYKGHGTDKALVAGILGFGADDVRLRRSFEIAAERQVKILLKTSDAEVAHPNTVRIRLTGKSGRTVEVVGVSLGGGKIEVREIDGFDVLVTGEEHTLMTFHRDKPGIISRVSGILAADNINVSTMRVFRSGKNENAVMILSTDSPVPAEMVEEIKKIDGISNVIAMLPL
ncbi:L-serine ammonia-lyase, iron-sulfur-dependent subunit beta [Colibacter massiliensis]|uniref:L-serine ammonia-lyase, iron-sulfur-dependent subunit beta n=1 Tax=Colibacter massiliensis TaxID=1852379 RepID=UPI00094E522A|nr:L-serine ammonia-lyase, iron-sulfur-dependent subunit beta [Colibacter massiliensis]